MILSARSLCFAYNGRPILDGADLAVRPGEILALLGPNGAGKTTLLRCLGAMLVPQAGAVFVEGEDLLRLPRTEVARRLGYVPQRAETARLTVFDAVLLGRKPHMGWRPRERDLRLTEAVLGRVGLEELALRAIDSLSGGELQRTCLARALVQEPRALLLDEPTSALDLSRQLEVMGAIRSVVREGGLAAVAAMHDLNMALRFADRFLFLKDGRVLAHCGPDDVRPEIIQATYGVAVAILRHGDRSVVIPLD